MKKKSSSSIKLLLLNKDHLEMVRKWRNSKEVSNYMYNDDYITPEGQIEWFNRVNTDNTKMYWVIEVDGVFAGVINLYNIDRKNKSAFWAYYIAILDVRGKGVGKTLELNILKFVFDELKLNKLSCEVFCSNEIVIKIHQKYGSKIEGTLREHIYKNGIFQDVVRMSILKQEWESEIVPAFDIPDCKIEV